MNIDFSKFKKIECDNHATTLQHPSGHTIKIAHKGLSPKVKAELDEVPMHLAKGGRAKYAQQYDPNMASKASKPAKSTNTMPGSPTEAKDNYTEPDAMGTSIPKGMLQEEMKSSKTMPDVVVSAMNKKAPPFGPLSAEPEGHTPPCINPSCKSYGHSHPNCRCYGGKMGMYGGFAEGGEVEKENFCDANRTHFKGCEYFKAGGQAGTETEPDVSETQAPPNPMPTPQDTPPVGSNGATPAPEPSPEMPDDVNPNQEISGNDQAPEAEQPQADTSVQQPQTPQTPAQQVMQKKQENMQQLHPEVQAFQADLDNGHITPETYSSLFAKKDTLGKIGTIFGMLFSSAGSGLAHQPNMLLAMMDKQIGNDLAAQQESQTNKQNYLRINQQNVLNQANAKNITAEANTKAFALSRAQMNLAAMHKLVTDTQKLPEGPQKQQAMQTLAMMNQGVQNENFNILDRAATASALSGYLTGGQNGGANTTVMKSGLLGPEAKEVGSDVEQKTIPGIPGKANRPIEQHDRDQVTAMNVLDNKANDILKFAQQHKGSLNPNILSQGGQKAAELVTFYNQSIGSGVLTQGRLAWLDSQIGKNPTSIFQDVLGNNAKLKEIKNSNLTRRDTLLQSYGYKPQTPTAQGQAQTAMKNGIQYKKVQGGWKRAE